MTVQAAVPLNGSTVLRAIDISFVLSRPLDVPVANSDLAAALAEAKVWIASAGFVDEILNNEI